MALSSYQDLLVWRRARSLVLDVYVLCNSLPRDEVYGLCSQMKRSAVSIPSNIAEGYRRNNRREYLQFLGVALGSAAELETQLLLVNDIYAVDTAGQVKDVGEIQSMLLAMRRKLNPTP